MLPNFWCILGHCLIETHIMAAFPLWNDAIWALNVFVRVQIEPQSLGMWKNRPIRTVWGTPPPSPHRDDLTPCSTVLTVHCEFSVWWSSDKLSEDPRPKKNNFVSSADKMLCYFSLGQSLWLFWQIVTCPAKVIFFPQWVLQGLLTDSLSSHRSFF